MPIEASKNIFVYYDFDIHSKDKTFEKGNKATVDDSIDDDNNKSNDNRFYRILI